MARTLLTTALALGALTLLCGCGLSPWPWPVSVHVGKINDDVSGDDVARTIDIQLDPFLRGLDPAFRPSHASCAAHLDLSDGKVARCTVPVGGTALSVPVTGGPEPGTYAMHLGGSLLAMSHTEDILREGIVGDYGVTADVACGAPRLRVVPAGTHVRCALRGTGLPRSIEFKVLDTNGHIFVYRLAGLRSSSIELYSPYLTLHRAGRQTIMPGRRVAELIRRSLHPMSPSSAKLLRGLHVDCPPRADLTGDRRVHCTATTVAGTMPYEVWIDRDANFNARPLRLLVDTAGLRDDAERVYDDKLEAAGFAKKVTVDCGPARVISYDRETTVACTLDAGDGARPMTVSFPRFPDPQPLYNVPPR